MPPVKPATTMFRNECTVSTFDTPPGQRAIVETGGGGTRPHSQPDAQLSVTTPDPAAKPVLIVAWKQAGSATSNASTSNFDGRAMRPPEGDWGGRQETIRAARRT